MNLWNASTKTGKVWKLSTENFCRAILSGQNDDMLYEVGFFAWEYKKPLN